MPIANPTAASLSNPSGLSNLTSLTVSLDSFHAGDVLAMANLSGLNITQSYGSGTLTLSGSDTVAHYQQALRFLTYDNTTGTGPGVTQLQATVIASDGTLLSSPVTTTIATNVASGQVLGNRLFYNNSKYDGNNSAINGPSDDLAIASDKVGFVSGTASFDNVSSFFRGITGVMVDLQSGIGTHGNITLSSNDIVFKVAPSVFNSSTYNNFAAWSTAPTPLAISTRIGAGTGGSDRVEITWNNDAIKNTWLEVEVLANANTGLSTPDIFFFGSAVGDSGAGDTAAIAVTNSTDVTLARNNIVGLTTPQWNPVDYTKDGAVNSSDATIATNNPFTLHYISNAIQLSLLTPGGGSPDQQPSTSSLRRSRRH